MGWAKLKFSMSSNWRQMCVHTKIWVHTRIVWVNLWSKSRKLNLVWTAVGASRKTRWSVFCIPVFPSALQDCFASCFVFPVMTLHVVVYHIHHLTHLRRDPTSSSHYEKLMSTGIHHTSWTTSNNKVVCPWTLAFPYISWYVLSEPHGILLGKIDVKCRSGILPIAVTAKKKSAHGATQLWTAVVKTIQKKLWITFESIEQKTGHVIINVYTSEHTQRWKWGQSWTSTIFPHPNYPTSCQHAWFMISTLTIPHQ